MRIAALFLCWAVLPAAGQIAASNRIDWAANVTVGVLGGIPARTTIFTNMPAGATAAQISAAIQAAPSNSVVQLAAGTNELSTYIDFGGRDGVTLRGHESGTVLSMTNSGVGLMVLLAGTAGDAGQTTLGPGIALTSGYTKGSTTVVAVSVSGLSASQSMIVTQDDDTNFVIRASGSKTNGSLRQRVVIQGISGTNVTFWPPLVWSMASALNPRIYGAGNQIERSGVESITFRPGHADISVLGYLNNARECWVAGTSCTNFPAAGWELNWTVFCEVRSNLVYGTSSTADGYGIKVNSDTSSALVEDNSLGDSFTGIIASQHSACVFAFNYCTNSWVDNGFVGITASYNVNHGPHPIMSLWEGNVGTAILNDGYHGSASHQTYFRNHLPSVQNIHSNAHGGIIELRRWSYYNGAEGNVLGADWATNATYYYQATEAQWASAAYNNNGSMWLLGGTWAPWDAQVEATLTRSYNWDAKTQGVADGTVSIPSSRFRSERPAWFGGVAWPPIGPDVSGRAQMIPAEYRFRGLTLPSVPGDSGTTLTPTTLRAGTLRGP